MRHNLIRAALMTGLFLGAGTAPVFANALDSQLQPIAAPIPRETVPFGGRESPGHHHHPLRRAPTLPRHAGPSGAQVRRRRRTARVYMGPRHPYRVQAGVAGLDAAAPDAEASARPSPTYRWGAGQSAWCARDVSRGHALSIHGSNEPDTIGQAVSSGCIRMTNQDVIDLYERARVGARVVVTR